MTNTWDDMRKAKEGEYFQKKNKEALDRLSKMQKAEQPRLSPITGEPMEQTVIHGVVVDRCSKSGGIWLDKGELEQLMASHDQSSHNKDQNFIEKFFKELLGR